MPDRPVPCSLPQGDPTPLGKNVRTFHAQSLQANDRHFNISQYRARIADDMSHTPVLLDVDYLLDEVLAFPSHIPAAATVMPKLTKSPFSPGLDEAGQTTTTEKEVSAGMVRH